MYTSSTYNQLYSPLSTQSRPVNLPSLTNNCKFNSSVGVSTVLFLSVFLNSLYRYLSTCHLYYCKLLVYTVHVIACTNGTGGLWGSLTLPKRCSNEEHAQLESHLKNQRGNDRNTVQANYMELVFILASTVCPSTCLKT